MKRKRQYRIKIEDEAYLRTVSDIRMSGAGLTLIIIAAVLISLLVSGGIIMTTPLRTLLPGYLKQSQRSANEENLLRLDSLQEVYEQKQAYIDNYLRVIDDTRQPSDSSSMAAMETLAPEDSLMTATDLERRFVNTMEEREKFNISVLAPLAADGVGFRPIDDRGIFTADSRDSEAGTVLLPPGADIKSVADGVVLGVYYSADERGFTVLTQHKRGFVTSVSHAGRPAVGTGDEILAGQAIASGPTPDAKGRRSVTVRMWHNGLPIAPYKYIGKSEEEPDDSRYEDPRGKF